MKKVLLLATGGTIASRPTAQGGLAPAITPQELLQFVPELAELCQIETIQLYHLDSTNIGPQQWLGMAQALRQHYDAYDGFVITHGTDTMAYTASALSYMLRNIPIPVVFTGSQLPFVHPLTDATDNIRCAVAMAMSGKPSITGIPTPATTCCVPLPTPGLRAGGACRSCLTAR